MPAVLIVSPLFPPRPGGLPDHTDRLASALSAHGQVRVLTSTGCDDRRSFEVHPQMARWDRPSEVLHAIQQVHPEGPVLWQYVPHMYGRGGMNLGVPRVMRALAASGRRQLVLVHEIAAPLSVWPHRLLYALAHRLMWRQLRQTVDALGISTDAWLTRLRESMRPSGPTLFLAPSPSNLPGVEVPTDHGRLWRERQGIAPGATVAGFFGSPGTGKQFDWVLAAWRALREADPLAVLVTVGDPPSVRLPASESRDFRPLGYLAAGPASEALQAMDLLVLPFADGVSERRSSFMAGLSHGRAVLTTFGLATGASLRESGCCGGTPVDAGPGAFAAAAAAFAGKPDRRAELGARARRHYRTHFDWPCLAATLATHLDQPSRFKTSVASTS